MIGANVLAMRCDERGCDHVIVSVSPIASTIQEVARRAGWATGARGDYCPEHGPAGVRRYRRLPQTVEAIQWMPGNEREVEAFVGFTAPSRFSLSLSPLCAFLNWEHHCPQLWVEKAKSWISIEHGTWIIRELDESGFYPCGAETFAAIYAPEDDQ